MKSDAAAAGIVHRISQQVIDIDQHGRNHCDPGFREIPAKENAGNGSRYQAVQEQVNDRPQHRIG